MAALREGLALNQEAADDPASTVYDQLELARGHNNLGLALAQQGRFEEALAAVEQGLAIRRKLAEHTAVAKSSNNLLGYSYEHRGILHALAGRPPEAAADLRRALELWQRPNAPHGGTPLERARELALLAGLAAASNSGVSAAEGRRFADQAMEVLRKDRRPGWVYLAELKASRDFNRLRQREDFQDLFRQQSAKISHGK